MTTEKNQNSLYEKMKIRHHFDDKSGELHFSIVDIIENLDLSKDPRNYWKVLKNRFKKGDNQLVTNCNQLKILAKDGKYYQTDVANANTILKIIQIISPEKVKIFSEYFDKLEEKISGKEDEIEKQNNELSTLQINEGELQIDMYKKDNYLFVKTMIAGISPENIFISVKSNKLIIRGNKTKNKENQAENYFLQELFWEKFSRTIPLPYEVDIDGVEATIIQGMVMIRLLILDKERMKIIKIKNL